jgi:N-acylneuraminate cytidylyltransferase/CMP-N,N'-diacetyllegionaminic acid synthase
LIAIIPARGGSKGLPGKNTKVLSGRPLICHTISVALEAESVSRVIVSTDDNEIARIAKGCGAEVPFMRPKAIAGDNSMVMDTYFFTLDCLEAEENESVDAFVALLPTVPLRLPEDIDGAVDIFLKNNADSVISVTEAPVPIEWYRKIEKDGRLCNYLPEFTAVANRQEHDGAYIPNGAVYVFRTEKLRATRQYYLDDTYPYVMPKSRSLDIDEPLDFEWVEFLMHRKGK